MDTAEFCCVKRQKVENRVSKSKTQISSKLSFQIYCSRQRNYRFPLLCIALKTHRHQHQGCVRDFDFQGETVLEIFFFHTASTIKLTVLFCSVLVSCWWPLYSPSHRNNHMDKAQFTKLACDCGSLSVETMRNSAVKLKGSVQHKVNQSICEAYLLRLQWVHDGTHTTVGMHAQKSLSDVHNHFIFKFILFLSNSSFWGQICSSLRWRVVIWHFKNISELNWIELKLLILYKSEMVLYCLK